MSIIKKFLRKRKAGRGDKRVGFEKKLIVVKKTRCGGMQQVYAGMYVQRGGRTEYNFFFLLGKIYVILLLFNFIIFYYSRINNAHKRIASYKQKPRAVLYTFGPLINCRVWWPALPVQPSAGLYTSQHSHTQLSGFACKHSLHN